MRMKEGPLVYSEMEEKTGLTIAYTPRGNAGVELRATGQGPDISATFSNKRIDEAHILYMEVTELLRSRAKLGQSPIEIRRAVDVLFAMFRGEKISPEIIASVSAPRAISSATPPVNKPIDVDGTTYDRLLVKSRLITLKDKDLLPLIEEYAGPYVRPGDTLFVSEKALTITQGRVVDMSTIKSGYLARLFARNVKNNFGSNDFHGFGHGTPLAMQLFIEEAGYARAIFAAVVSAITRPFGIRGLFYYLCGTRAKSVDLPMSFLILEYAHSAKLAPKDPTGEAKRFKARPRTAKRSSSTPTIEARSRSANRRARSPKCSSGSCSGIIQWVSPTK